jgi:hypothetical protein
LATCLSTRVTRLSSFPCDVSGSAFQSRSSILPHLAVELAADLEAFPVVQVPMAVPADLPFPAFV